MDFIVKKTTELTTEDINQINNLFNQIFDRERDVEGFLDQSIKTPLQYSYHSMMIDDGKIVGLNSFVPSFFLVRGKKVLFANSIDSMVAKPYRDYFNFHDMVMAGFKKLKKEGFAFVYGYPNDNSYPVVIKGKLYKDIGKMRTYCMPYKIGGIKRYLTFLNPVSKFLAYLYVWSSGLFAKKKICKYLYEKDAATYNTQRYLRGGSEYKKANLGNCILYYTIKIHEGVRTAFIIDLSVKSPKIFNQAMKYLLKNHRADFDLILYPGWLNFSNTSLIRLPRKLEPKNFNFTGKILEQSLFDESIWDIKNWDTNLSNYDLI